MKFKKFALAGLTCAAVLGLASCKETPEQKNSKLNAATGNTSEKDLDVYNSVLGNFSKTYDAAKKIADDSERYAQMAKAEAQLLASAVFTPTTTRGGNYAITRVAPRTIPYALWGADEYRYNHLLVTTDLIKASDRKAMLAEWADKKGSDGYDYQGYVKTYLSNHGYTLKNTYTQYYTEGTNTWDWLNTSYASDTEVLNNLVDGLLVYNGENEQVNALATSYTKTAANDGKVKYTFTLRDNVYWASASTGQKTEHKLKAQDFVSGLQHIMDAQGGNEWLLEGVIDNASEYLSGEITDFSKVGVKALSDTQLEYTLTSDISYFPTYLSYNVYQPIPTDYYEEKGGVFGIKEYAEASAGEGYTYGKNFTDVLTVGPYYVQEYADNGKVVYQKNTNYWDAENTTINTITWLYNDGKDELKGYNSAIDGTVDASGLNTAAVTKAKADKKFDDFAYISDTDATTYFAAYNVNRQNYVLSNGGVASAKKEKDAVLTTKALKNNKVRLALTYAFDKATWNAQSVGDELKLNALRNSYTPWDFVSLTKDVTLDGKTYTKGTAYGEIMTDQLKALGVKADLHDGVNGWYDAALAKTTMEAAVKELAADGVTVDAKNKIKLDVFYYSASKNQTNQANAYKKSIEDALGDFVEVNLVEATTTDDYYASGYRAANGAAANYDVFYGSGWGPDYGDPSTYLDTFLGEGAGYMTKTIGLF